MAPNAARRPRPARAQSDRSEGIRDINVTPIIDVALVLVIILLVASPMAFESTIGLRRASLSARKAPVEQRLERVELSIVSDDSVRVNRTMVPRPQLTAALLPLLKSVPPPAVIVTCADQVSHGTFVEVIDEAKMCGAPEIAFTPPPGR